MKALVSAAFLLACVLLAYLGGVVAVNGSPFVGLLVLLAGVKGAFLFVQNLAR